MKKLTILCDADDTVENLLIHWIAELNKRYGLNIQKEDVHSWNLSDTYSMLKPEQVYEPIYRKEFWKQITPMEDSSYYMQKLIQDGHDLYIVTAANFETSDAKVARLLELFPFMSWKKIIAAYHKQMIRGDVLIDDGVHNLVNGQYYKILFHQPHNASIDEKQYGITRVRSWKEIYRIISDIVSDKSKGDDEYE